MKSMRGFLIGTALFIGWWLLMAIAFWMVGVIITVLFSRISEPLHVLLWLIYMGTVLIGGTVFVSFGVKRFKRS
jgi:hypothetical protein